MCFRARETEDGMPETAIPGISDEIIRLPSITATGKKTKSADLHVEPNGDAKVLIKTEISYNPIILARHNVEDTIFFLSSK